MSALAPCRSCHRHCRITETSCPFCGVRRVAIGAGLIAMATLAIACDGPAAQTPNNTVVIPQPTTSASSSPITTSDDAGSAPAPTASNPDLNRAAPMYGLPPVSTATPPPDVHRAAPMYGLPPPSNR